MKPSQPPASDIAFTPTVKAIQSRKGSRATYAGMEQRGGWQTAIEPDLAAFIEQVRSFFLATANSEGQPYVQHRGGPPGFLRVLDNQTLGFADFKGNRQFITTGNLEDNPKAFIFLIDYVLQRRIKIWGTAKMVEATPALLSRLMLEGYRARPEQIVLFEVEAWDVNCPQHIPQRFEADDVARVLAKRDARIAELEALLAARDGT
ncbi:pyridoxamine 5'-phosphate oxidase family protein [Hoeflea alexandrii]|uniref:Pyridoxamine 5'-phosphate oxidase n=1 Tax=Hoeflea alexandrii TaxID=288436 RepID=A0ABT1CLZ8_9HYPH|nr:pyridoxamine 5'-phosphate oxidase family protein [Hoeflea alexandrii]MCO6407204.1 pyridoxamine 5'-phosphate oxidase [Hoeflea alexandrii]MCY0154375.1 pyridoxamine 5'-phosphate oxidase family protein [Hoeflea alexandrii]